MKGKIAGHQHFCYPGRMKKSSWLSLTGRHAGFARAIPRVQYRMRAGILAIFIVVCEVAYGQSLDEINKREEAVREAWQKTPLTVRRALFVTEEPSGFGIYTPRPSGPFKSGERMIVYAEPVAFEWKNVDGQYEFGFKIDLIVKSADGKIIAEQNNFGNLSFKSRAQNRELFIHLDVDLNGAPPGDYLLDFKLHDAETDKTGMVELPFTLQ
jgi:hypothetical protein